MLTLQSSSGIWSGMVRLQGVPEFSGKKLAFAKVPVPPAC
jgi:hypothetical protein